MSKKIPSKGYSGVRVVIILVAVAFVAGGILAWQKAHQKDSNKVITANKTDMPRKSNTTLSLANDTVKFILPQSWTFVKGLDECIKDEALGYICYDGAAITPGDKLPTRYGGGTEFFDIQVSVFENPSRVDGKTWLVGDIVGDDYVVDSSNSPINGYDAYYRKTTYNGDGTTIVEVQYVFTSGNRAVLMYARTYEPGELADGTKVGDFRKFEASIAGVAQTVVIK